MKNSTKYIKYTFIDTFIRIPITNWFRMPWKFSYKIYRNSMEIPLATEIQWRFHRNLKENSIEIKPKKMYRSSFAVLWKSYASYMDGIYEGIPLKSNRRSINVPLQFCWHDTAITWNEIWTSMEMEILNMFVRNLQEIDILLSCIFF